MADTTNTTAAGGPSPVGLPDFGGSASGGAAGAIGMLSDVSLQVRIELGRTKMLVEDVLRLNPDSVVELDKAAGDPVDIYVNGRRIARGEVLVLNENFCVRVSEIIEPLEG
ncbi:MAG: flagellar motor switch protein FliN [Phycisphaerales bacterium]|jgi:flagellar motor switch protein FliN/FliY